MFFWESNQGKRHRRDATFHAVGKIRKNSEKSNDTFRSAELIFIYFQGSNVHLRFPPPILSFCPPLVQWMKHSPSPRKPSTVTHVLLFPTAWNVMWQRCHFAWRFFAKNQLYITGWKDNNYMLGSYSWCACLLWNKFFSACCSFQ